MSATVTATNTATEQSTLNFQVSDTNHAATQIADERPSPDQSSTEIGPKSATRTGCCHKPYYDVVLNYRLAVEKGGDEIIWGGTYGQMRRKYDKTTVRIYDERGHEDNFSLDVHGFQLVRNKAKKITMVDDMVPHKGTSYDDECEELMKKITGGSSVYVISTLTRRRSWKDTTAEQEAAGEEKPDMEMTKGNLSARFVHCDQSYQGARRQLYEVLGAEKASEMEKHRWAIINIWRPLETINNEPLGVTDARSIREDELVDTMHLVPVRWPNKPPENHMWSVKPPQHKEQHKWHFFSHMTTEECLFITIFDSKKDGRARRVPHSAFPTPDDFGPARRSIETRCFVFWDDQETA